MPAAAPSQTRPATRKHFRRCGAAGSTSRSRYRTRTHRFGSTRWRSAAEKFTSMTSRCGGSSCLDGTTRRLYHFGNTGPLRIVAGVSRPIPPTDDLAWFIFKPGEIRDGGEGDRHDGLDRRRQMLLRAAIGRRLCNAAVRDGGAATGIGIKTRLSFQDRTLLEGWYAYHPTHMLAARPSCDAESGDTKWSFSQTIGWIDFAVLIPATRYTLGPSDSPHDGDHIIAHPRQHRARSELLDGGATVGPRPGCRRR